MPDQPQPLHGLGVSPGVGAGPAYRLAPPPALPAEQAAVEDLAEESRRATTALDEVGGYLEHQASSATATAAEVLSAQAMMARDPSLAEAVTGRVLDGVPGPWAVDAALRQQQDVFTEMGGYFAERAADLDDIRARAIALLLDLPMPGVPSPGVPFVLVADDLAPADTAQLDPSRVRALVTARGGPTSHTAILAKALGIPAVVACHGVLDLADTTPVAVDGITGSVTVLRADEVDAVQARADAARRAAAAVTGPGRTADGHPVKLLLNVGSAKDLDGVDPDGFEGVGLVRSEFLYLGRTDAPTPEEQELAYVELFTAMGGRKVVLRTLDAGADKPLPFLNPAVEANPALGVRGLRTVARSEGVLTDQLAAIATAAAAEQAEVWVMAPMVATADETADFVARCAAAGLATAGVMVEVPSAALTASHVLASAHFASIGTNDLGQYTMAADRLLGELAQLNDPWQPAVLRLVQLTCAAGQERDRPVGVCGEAAADPALACVLVGLGVSSLSMTPRSIPDVADVLLATSYDDCVRLAELAVAAPSAAGARAAVRRELPILAELGL